MYEYYFSLVFSSTELEQKYYRQGLRHIVVFAHNGLRVQLALKHLVPFISGNGIRGRFKLVTDARHSFVSLQKVAEI